MLRISYANNRDLILDSINPESIVEFLRNNPLSKEEITIDISDLNLLDACRISTICSTNEYIKDSSTHINWLVSSSKVESLVNPLSLGNSSFICE